MRIRVRKTQVIILCTLLLRIFLVSVESSQEFIVTKNESKQRGPAVYGNIVVWTDSRNGNRDIYGYNLETKKEFQITTDPEDQNDPAIYNNIVVWTDSRNGNRDIYGYNLLTDEEFSICTIQGIQCDSVIYDDIVVWKNYEEDTPDICGYNLSTHQEVAIGENPNGGSPAIYGDIVVWEMYKDHHGIISGYNLLTHEEFEINAYSTIFSRSHTHRNPSIYNNIVIWTEIYDIYGYDLSTSKRFPIAKMYSKRCHGSYGSKEPKIYKNLVVWTGCRNKNQDIYGYDLLTDQEFQITTHEDQQHSPAIYENTVVWADYRNGNWDIYGAYISHPYSNTLSKSKIRMYISDHFDTVIWIFVISTSVWVIGRFIWYINNYGDTPGAVPQSGIQKDFQKTFLSNTYYLVFAVIFVPMGVITIFEMDHTGILYLVISAIYALIFIWRQKFPYIRITDDKIILFKNIAYNPKVINIIDIQKINVKTWTSFPYKAYIFLNNGEKIGIFFSSFSREDKKDIVQTLTKLVGHS